MAYALSVLKSCWLLLYLIIFLSVSGSFLTEILHTTNLMIRQLATNTSELLAGRDVHL